MKQQNLNPSTQPGISLMVDSSWTLCVAALYPDCNLSEEDKLSAQHLLRNLILQSDEPYKKYLEVCQRVLLTRERMIHDRSFGISSIPWRFFNSSSKGYAVSAGWYEELLSARKQFPSLKLHFRALAEAVLEFAGEPTAENFNYWREWFIANNLRDEWHLYAYCAAHFFSQSQFVK